MSWQEPHQVQQGEAQSLAPGEEQLQAPHKLGSNELESSFAEKDLYM